MFGYKGKVKNAGKNVYETFDDVNKKLNESNRIFSEASKINMEPLTNKDTKNMEKVEKNDNLVVRFNDTTFVENMNNLSKRIEGDIEKNTNNKDVYKYYLKFSQFKDEEFNKACDEFKLKKEDLNENVYQRLLEEVKQLETKDLLRTDDIR